ncbi:MAG TPA: hypothetical protein VGX76_15115 [Pirellulales bacterium]|jgi:hypothetical protein|nr:hypothetical protein [Pirellulales bacterium]
MTNGHLPNPERLALAGQTRRAHEEVANGERQTAQRRDELAACQE